jgi:hypothetical protein
MSRSRITTKEADYGAHPYSPRRAPCRRVEGNRDFCGWVGTPDRRAGKPRYRNHSDTALRLGHWFGTSPEFWLNLQKHYELRLAREAVGDRIKKLPKLGAARVRVG